MTNAELTQALIEAEAVITLRVSHVEMFVSRQESQSVDELRAESDRRGLGRPSELQIHSQLNRWFSQL